MKCRIAVILVALALVCACARTLNVLDNVQKGSSETQAKASVRASPTWTFENERTKFIVYGFIATFLDMYDNTITYYFVKLQDGKVVDKGMVGRKEREEIKKIDPNFDINRLKRKPHKPLGSIQPYGSALAVAGNVSN